MGDRRRKRKKSTDAEEMQVSPRRGSCALLYASSIPPISPPRTLQMSWPDPGGERFVLVADPQ
jgi:hypothetical protein